MDIYRFHSAVCRDSWMAQSVNDRFIFSNFHMIHLDSLLLRHTCILLEAGQRPSN